MQPDAVLDLAFAEITQPRRPLAILHQIIRHVLGEENVPGVTAIHHLLRHVNAGPGDVGASIHVGHLADRAAVNAHPHRKFRVFPERFGDLQRATRRLFRAMIEDQRHSIPGRQPNELSSVASRTGVVASTISVSWLSGSFAPRSRVRVTDDVDEEDVSDLEVKIVVRFRHWLFLPEAIL